MKGVRGMQRKPSGLLQRQTDREQKRDKENESEGETKEMVVSDIKTPLAATHTHSAKSDDDNAYSSPLPLQV